MMMLSWIACLVLGLNFFCFAFFKRVWLKERLVARSFLGILLFSLGFFHLHLALLQNFIFFIYWLNLILWRIFDRFFFTWVNLIGLSLLGLVDICFNNDLLDFAYKVSVYCFANLSFFLVFNVFVVLTLEKLKNNENLKSEIYSLQLFHLKFLDYIAPCVFAYLILFLSDYSAIFYFNYIKKFFLFALVFYVFQISSILSNVLVYLLMRKSFERADHDTRKRLNTLMNILNLGMKFFVYSTLLIITLSLFHVDTTPVFANFWILTAALSVSLQSFIKDFATGVMVLFEDTFHIGDEIVINNVEGQIEEISLRTLKVRSNDGALHFIPFNEFKIVCNRSKQYNIIAFNIVVDVAADHDLIVKIMQEAAVELKQSSFGPKILKDIDVVGIISFVSGCMVYEAKLRTQPMSPKNIKALYYSICKKALEQNNVPFAYDVVTYKKLFP